MTITTTPKSTTNILVIQVVGLLTCSIATNMIMALFQDSTANALAAEEVYYGTTAQRFNMTLQHTMVAGTTSPTTFKIRAGGTSGGTTTFNGNAGSRIFGAITKSSITIWEIKV